MNGNNPQSLQDAFDQIDADSSGYITLDDVRGFLQVGTDKRAGVVKGVGENVDSNGRDDHDRAVENEVVMREQAKTRALGGGASAYYWGNTAPEVGSESEATSGWERSE